MGSINILDCTSIRELREKLIDTIEGHLRAHPDRQRREADPLDAFHFAKARSFVFPAGRVALSLEEFAWHLSRITVHSLFYHVFVARLTPERRDRDFSVWIEEELGLKELAEEIRRLDPNPRTLEELPRDLDVRTVQEVLERHGIDPEKPIITQVSRFDTMKDPVGVIQAFREVRRREVCQLVLAGGGASDDPESQQVLARVREEAEEHPDIHVLELPPESDLEVNAIQRASTVIVQKSLGEGFGLTVTEAMWKGKPVVAGARRAPPGS